MSFGPLYYLLCWSLWLVQAEREMSTIAGVILTMAVIAAGLIMVLGNQWRWAIAGLAIQYLVVFLLISQIWPIGLAAIKLVTGWITCVLLWMSGSPSECTKISIS